MGENGAVFFVDSYAQIEIIKENPRYLQYRFAKGRYTKLNVYEVYLWLLRSGTQQMRDHFVAASQDKSVEIWTPDILRAAHMKMAHPQSGISMVDCIGYVVAKRLGIKFLTGDQAFRDMENVEFVQ